MLNLQGVQEKRNCALFPKRKSYKAGWRWKDTCILWCKFGLHIRGRPARYGGGGQCLNWNGMRRNDVRYFVQRPCPHWGELTALPRPQLVFGDRFAAEEGKKGKRRGGNEERERKGSVPHFYNLTTWVGGSSCEVNVVLMQTSAVPAAVARDEEVRTGNEQCRRRDDLSQRRLFAAVLRRRSARLCRSGTIQSSYCITSIYKIFLKHYLITSCCTPT